MSSTIDAPLEWVETVGNLRLPPRADQRLQALMDRNNEGLLTETERAELEALVELSERLSLVRAGRCIYWDVPRNDVLEPHGSTGGASRRRALRILSDAPVVTGCDIPRRAHCSAVSWW